MPFREKAKALFKTKSRNDSLSKSSTNTSDREQVPGNVYQPGEAMPKPKYRRPPEKAHKENLEAFSFSDAWRRKSFQSQYSPRGTRAPSRRNSFLTFGRKNSSQSKGNASRTNSVTGEGMEQNGVRPRDGLGAALPTRLSTEVEAEGDDDPTNVGLSRVQSQEGGPHSRPRSADKRPPNGTFHHFGTAHDHRPFTEDELTLALKRSHLAVPTQS